MASRRAKAKASAAKTKTDITSETTETTIDKDVEVVEVKAKEDAETTAPAEKTAPKETKTAPSQKAVTKKAKTVKAKPRAKKVVEIDKTDVVKTALWKSISKSKAKKMSGYNAIQIYAEGLDSFFIAIHDGSPMIERSFYEGTNRRGELFSSESELLKLSEGGYDIIAAVKSGAVNYYGDLATLFKMVDLF